MRSDATTVTEYLSGLEPPRREFVASLRQTVLAHLPAGFQEGMGYGMLSYHVPHSLFPAGYHCDPKMPLPFAAIASQKNFVAFYHMGVYSMPELLESFQADCRAEGIQKLDMGKSCIRFKKPEAVPHDAIGKLIEKLSPEQWIEFYRNAFDARTAKADRRSK